jgi:alpha-ketoglutarate-dependent taurine dioxygenase
MQGDHTSTFVEKTGEVRVGFLSAGTGRLPLVVEPAGRGERSTSRLCEWLSDRRQWVDQALLDHGALLLRGFAVSRPEEFERVAKTISPDLKNNYLGTSPRAALTEYVFSASELPSYYPIPQHCEMSFTRNPPNRLFFACRVAPRGPGGETPLSDFRKVYRDLDPLVRERFVQKGVRIIRNYCGPFGGSRFDLWKLKRWDEMFQTTDRLAVEESCRQNGFDFTWKPEGKLTLTHVQPAVVPHPRTGEPVWFNHSQVFHLSAAADEYRRVSLRQGGLHLALLRQFARAAVTVKKYATALEDQAMHCTYGDGTPIPDQDMDRVRDAVWKNMVFFRWQATDVLVIDNFAVAHGRMPYRGSRVVEVCWA